MSQTEERITKGAGESSEGEVDRQRNGRRNGQRFVENRDSEASGNAMSDVSVISLDWLYPKEAWTKNNKIKK